MPAVSAATAAVPSAITLKADEPGLRADSRGPTRGPAGWPAGAAGSALEPADSPASGSPSPGCRSGRLSTNTPNPRPVAQPVMAQPEPPRLAAGQSSYLASQSVPGLSSGKPWCVQTIGNKNPLIGDARFASASAGLAPAANVSRPWSQDESGGDQRLSRDRQNRRQRSGRRSHGTAASVAAW